MRFIGHLPRGIVVGSVFVLLLCAWSAPAKAEFVLAGWNFNGQTGSGTSPLPATETYANATVGGLTRGGGLTTAGTPPANAWGATGWNSADVNAAIAAGDVATFSLTPTSGNTLSFSSIAAYSIILGASSPPTTGQWQFQVGSGAFTNISTAITWSSGPQNLLDLSGFAALQNTVQTVTFRLVNWGGGNGTNQAAFYFNEATAGPGSDLQVMGTPEPTSLVLAGMVGVAGLAGSRFSLRKKKLKALLGEKPLAGE